MLCLDDPVQTETVNLTPVLAETGHSATGQAFPVRNKTKPGLPAPVQTGSHLAEPLRCPTFSTLQEKLLMMSLDTIEELSREAGVKAAKHRREPFVVFSASTAFEDLRRSPFLGDYVPRGWRPATAKDVGFTTAEHGVYGSDDDGITLFVDSSGMGAPGERALTAEEATALVVRALDHTRTVGTLGVGITTQGQFQVHIGLFLKPRLRAV